MSKVELFTRNATPFTKSGELDEDALRKLLQRFIDAKISIVPGSSGSGEGFNLTRDELRRLFKVCVEECKGKIRVIGNPPEQHSAKNTRELAQIGVEAGVDVACIFPAAGWHGMKPTDHELTCYYDDVLSAIKHPVTLAVNPIIGYTQKVEFVAQLCKKFTQVESVILVGVPDVYMIELKSLVNRDIRFYAPLNGSANWVNLGATGIFSAESNIIPKTFRRYMDALEQNNAKEMSVAYSELKRFIQYVSKYNHANIRLLKMCMRALKLPGGEGTMREPYQYPPGDEMEKFTDGLLRLRLPEIDEQAKAAGLRIPS